MTVTAPPAPAATYLLNQAVTASYGCADGGSGVASCAAPVANGAPIDTAAVGAYSFAVTGIDNVGHTVTLNRPYVVSFNICAQYDQARAHRAGSTVPIRLQLCDASGNNVSSASITLTATAVAHVSTGAPGVLEDSGNSNPDNAFRFAGGGYVFNLQTTGFAAGTYELTLMATGDPNPHQVQVQIR